LGTKRRWHAVLTGLDAKRLRISDALTPVSTAPGADAELEGFADFFDATPGSSRWLEAHLRSLDANCADLFSSVRDAPPDVFVDDLSYCKRHDLWLQAKRKIAGGVLLFVRSRNGARLVIKNQKIDVSARDFLMITPGQWGTELLAMVTMRALMAIKGTAPIFCEMLHNEMFLDARVGALQSSMRLSRYDANLMDWLVQPQCFSKPPVNVSADAGDLWTFSAGGGRALALSSHPSDVRLFNAILRAIVFQVFLGLAQAQRHVRYCHNDLHTANVMLTTTMLQGSKKIITGFGTFVLPNNCPTVRIIDFQHSSFDVVSSTGEFVRRARGFQTSWSNERGFLYDTWRFSSHLLLEGLFHLLPFVDADMQTFLWRAAQMPGVPHMPPPRIVAQRHWTPYLMRGLLPEQIVCDRSGPFQCFFGDPNAAAVHIFVERGDDVFPCAVERYMRTVFVQTFPSQRSLAHYAERLPARPEHAASDAAFAENLKCFVINFQKRVAITLSSSMSMFTVRERAIYLFRELEIFQLGMHVLWKLDGATLANLASGGPMLVCAAADAAQVVMRSDLHWTHRAAGDSHVAFFDAVKSLLRPDGPIVRAAANKLPISLPCHTTLSDFLCAEHEHHLEALKGREVLSVTRKLYE